MWEGASPLPQLNTVYLGDQNSIRTSPLGTLQHDRM